MVPVISCLGVFNIRLSAVTVHSWIAAVMAFTRVQQKNKLKQLETVAIDSITFVLLQQSAQ